MSLYMNDTERKILSSVLSKIQNTSDYRWDYSQLCRRHIRGEKISVKLQHFVKTYIFIEFECRGVDFDRKIIKEFAEEFKNKTVLMLIIENGV